MGSSWSAIIVNQILDDLYIAFFSSRHLLTFDHLGFEIDSNSTILSSGNNDNNNEHEPDRNGSYKNLSTTRHTQENNLIFSSVQKVQRSNMVSNNFIVNDCIESNPIWKNHFYMDDYQTNLDYNLFCFMKDEQLLHYLNNSKRKKLKTNNANSVNNFNGTETPNNTKKKKKIIKNNYVVENDNDLTLVILKFRDKFDGIKIKKIELLSDDIFNALNKRNKYNSKKSIPMQLVFNRISSEWYLPNLRLPEGLFKFRFLVNDEHLLVSNFLPISNLNDLKISTNNSGKKYNKFLRPISSEDNCFINWFKINGMASVVEPYCSPNINFNNIKLKMSLNNKANDTNKILSSRGKLHKFELSQFELRKKEKIEYTNEIPPLFIFDENYYNKIQLKKNEHLGYCNDIEIFNKEKKNDVLRNQYIQKSDKTKDFDVFNKSILNEPQSTIFDYLQYKYNTDIEQAEINFLNERRLKKLPDYFNEINLEPIRYNKSLTNISSLHVNLNRLILPVLKDSKKKNGNENSDIENDHDINNVFSSSCIVRYRDKLVTQILYQPLE